MGISIGFALKGPVKEFDFWNVFKQGLYGVQFFLVFMLSRVNRVYEFAKFSPQILSKIL